MVHICFLPHNDLVWNFTLTYFLRNAEERQMEVVDSALWKKYGKHK